MLMCILNKVRHLKFMYGQTNRGGTMGIVPGLDVKDGLQHVPTRGSSRLSSLLFVGLLVISLIDRQVGAFARSLFGSIVVRGYHLYIEVAEGERRYPVLCMLPIRLGQGRIRHRQLDRSLLKGAAGLRLPSPTIMHDDSLGGAAGGVSAALDGASFASQTVEVVLVLSHVRRLFDRVRFLREADMKGVGW